VTAKHFACACIKRVGGR